MYIIYVQDFVYCFIIFLNIYILNISSYFVMFCKAFDFLYENFDFLYESSDFLYEKSLAQVLVITELKYHNFLDDNHAVFWLIENLAFFNPQLW